MSSRSPAIPRDSVVLVTGVNGFVASHIGDHILANGYRVRGTVRDKSKGEMMSEVYEKRHGDGRFEFAEVPDLGMDHAFDNAIDGCSAVVHVASDVSFSPDPTAVISLVIKSMENLLKAAAATPSIKRFVYTSSSTAATQPKPNKKFHVDSSTWNNEDVESAWRPPPYEPERAYTVYSASKTLAERAGVDFVNERRPAFVFNSVLPDTVFGELLHPRQGGSTSSFVRLAWAGKEVSFFKQLAPQHMVNVTDVARLHLSALVEPDVQNERLFAWAEPFNYNDVMRILRKMDPERNIPADIEDESRDLSTVDTTRSIELLKRMGRDGFIGLDESVRDCTRE